VAGSNRAARCLLGVGSLALLGSSSSSGGI
jgi:hypothetical protein